MSPHSENLAVQNKGSVVPSSTPRPGLRRARHLDLQRGTPGDSCLKQIKPNCRRWSHGPVGRLPGVKRSAELNRPQASGYSLCEIALGPQMLREPLGGGFRRAIELVGVSREVTAGVELQPLRFAGAVKRRQAEVGGADNVGVAEYHE